MADDKIKIIKIILNFWINSLSNPRQWTKRSESSKARRATFPLLLFPLSPDMGFTFRPSLFPENILNMFFSFSKFNFFFVRSYLPFLYRNSIRYMQTAKNLIHVCNGLIPYCNELGSGTNNPLILFERSLNCLEVAWQMRQFCIDFVSVIVFKTFPSIKVKNREKWIFMLKFCSIISNTCNFAICSSM